MLLNKFNYRTYKKTTSKDGYRVYDTPSGKLPSVTTILSETKSEESKKALDAWAKRVGKSQAETIKTTASNRGNLMHKWLENHIAGIERKCGSNLIHKQSYSMAQEIIQKGLKNVNEYWGSEVTLYMPELYAGTTDVVGVWKNTPAIIDFKQSNRIKTEKDIIDYKMQLAAYALAHNELYNTDINTGVIMMCTPDINYLEFSFTGAAFADITYEWVKRVEQFYEL